MEQPKATGLGWGSGSGGLPAVDEVTAEGIVKAFGATVALRGVSARFEAGRVTMVEGANGSGKTTLLRILGTVLRPSGGTVRYGALGNDPAQARRVIGWVSHETLTYGDLSGRYNVELAARLHGVDVGEAFRQVRERFELGPFVERPMRTYSRGQRQRVALARALVHRPSVVLLDEPTAGLDRSGVERLLGVVKAEAERGAVVVVVSHEAEVFAEVATARVVLDRGRVVSLRG